MSLRDLHSSSIKAITNYFDKNNIQSTFLKDHNINTNFLFKYKVENVGITFGNNPNNSQQLINSNTLKLIDLQHDGAYLQNMSYVDPSTNSLTVMTWDNIKNHGGELLKDYALFRQDVVMRLVHQIKNSHKCSKCTIISTGTNNITSDLDISLYGHSAFVIIDEFLLIMEKIFGKSLAIMFDCNLYADSFYEPINIENFNYVSFDEEGNVVNTKTYRNLYTNGIDKLNQHVWAFLKIYMHCYKYKLNKAICNNDANPKIYARTNVRKMFNEIIKNAHSKIDSLFIKLIHSTMNKFDTLMNFPQITTETDKFDSDSIIDFEDIQVMNDNYIRTLKKMWDKKSYFSSLTDQTEYFLTLESAKLKDIMSHCNFFAVESYFTQGAFYHIVVREGKKQKINMMYYEYLDSFIENIGDALKDVNTIQMNPKYKHLTEVKDKMNIGIIKSSKYLMRVFMALKNLYEIILNILNPNDKIRELQTMIKLGTNNFLTLQTVKNVINILTVIRHDVRSQCDKTICVNIKKLLNNSNFNILYTSEETRKLINEFLTQKFYVHFRRYFEFKKYSELKIWLMYMFKAYTSTILQHMYSDSSTILDLTDE